MKRYKQSFLIHETERTEKMITRYFAHSTKFFVVLILTICPAYMLLADAAFDSMQNTVGFLAVEKQVYEELVQNGITKLQEVWYHDPVTYQQKPKYQEVFGTYFTVQWHGAAYIVSAKHVVADAAGRPVQRGRIYFNDEKGIRSELSLESMEEKPGSRWFFHESSDVAIHPLWRPIDKQVALQTIQTEVPVDPDNDPKIKLMDSVYAIGFPLAIGFGDSLNPSAKECKVASVKQRRTIRTDSGLVITGDFTILDQALAQGYSGAPIYLKPATNKLALIGIMSGVLPDVTGGKVSFIVPADCLMEVFKSPQFQAYERLQGYVEPLVPTNNDGKK